MNKQIVEYIQLSLGDKCQPVISPPEKSASQRKPHAPRWHANSACSLQPPVLKAWDSKPPYSSRSRKTLKVLQCPHTSASLQQPILACLALQNLPKALAMFWKSTPYKYSSPSWLNVKFTSFAADTEYKLLFWSQVFQQLMVCYAFDMKQTHCEMINSNHSCGGCYHIYACMHVCVCVYLSTKILKCRCKFCGEFTNSRH